MSLTRPQKNKQKNPPKHLNQTITNMTCTVKQHSTHLSFTHARTHTHRKQPLPSVKVPVRAMFHSPLTNSILIKKLNKA